VGGGREGGGRWEGGGWRREGRGWEVGWRGWEVAWRGVGGGMEGVGGGREGGGRWQGGGWEVGGTEPPVPPPRMYITVSKRLVKKNNALLCNAMISYVFGQRFTM
jgi:hypothetical protein